MSSVPHDSQPTPAKHVVPSPLGEPSPEIAERVLRRVPMQQRSAERVGRMLDACAELLDEVGYDKLTTTLIARRADVAIGSVYQFFGDKRVVVRALGIRNLDVYFARLAERIAGHEPEHWWSFVDHAVDEYIDMHRTVPGFRTLHFGDSVDVHLLDDSRTNNDVLADRLRDLLVERFDLPDKNRLSLALSIVVEAGDALVKLAFRSDPDGEEEILTETKTLIRDYLSQHVDGPS